MKVLKASVSRRKFLLAAAAGAAGGSAYLAGRKGTDREQGHSDASGARPGSGEGYRVTEHVQNYYRTAKI